LITAAWFDPAAAMRRPIQSTNAGVAEWFSPGHICSGWMDPSSSCQLRYPHRCRTISPNRDDTCRFAVFVWRLRYPLLSNQMSFGSLSGCPGSQALRTNSSTCRPISRTRPNSATSNAISECGLIRFSKKPTTASISGCLTLSTIRIENRIDNPFRFLQTMFIGCLVESPGANIVHSGVLAERSCLFCKTTLADAAFSNTNLTHYQLRFGPPHKTR
jgi:hypothetical protein